MLNYDLKEKKFVIKLPTRDDYYCMVSKKRLDKRTESVVMTYITEQEENLIDEGNNIIIHRGNQNFKVKASDIYCYGIIDFNNNSEDMDIISTFSWLDHFTIKGVCLPANYNYNKHQCVSINKKPMWYDTTKCEELARYAHGYLGKPERTLIFRQVC